MLGLATLIPTLTVWFATPAGFVAGLLTGVVVFAVGYGVLVRHEEKQPLNLWTEGR
jgi:predicted membrane channel-forming protein YqfA (hemolysin III family)